MDDALGDPAWEPLSERLTRALETTRVLAAETAAYAATRPIRLERRVDGETSSWIVTGITPAPRRLGILFGEIAHHSRATLDNFAVILAERHLGRSLSLAELKRLQFPICTSARDFRRWREDFGPWFDPATLSALMRVQPCHQQEFDAQLNDFPEWGRRVETFYGGNDRRWNPLLIAAGFDNQDKHRRINVTAHALQGASFPAGTEVLAWPHIEELALGDVVGQARGTVEPTFAFEVVAMDRETGLGWPIPSYAFRMVRHVAEGVVPHILGSTSPWSVLRVEGLASARW